MNNEVLDNALIDKKTEEHSLNSTFTQFKASQVTFKENRIELTRNRFVYETIDYADISEISIWRGFQLKNRWVIIVLCSSVILWCLYFLTFTVGFADKTSNVNLFEWFHRGSLLSFWGPFILICFASTGVWSATIKSHIATLTIDSNKIDLRIKEINDKKRLPELIAFLKMKVDTVVRK
jgi:hypothetical protein